MSRYCFVDALNSLKIGERIRLKKWHRKRFWETRKFGEEIGFVNHRGNRVRVKKILTAFRCYEFEVILKSDAEHICFNDDLNFTNKEESKHD